MCNISGVCAGLKKMNEKRFSSNRHVEVWCAICSINYTENTPTYSNIHEKLLFSQIINFADALFYDDNSTIFITSFKIILKRFYEMNFWILF